MIERSPFQRVSGAAIFAGIVTTMLTTLAFDVGFGVVRGDWNVSEGDTFAGVVAAQSLGLALVTVSALIASVVLLTPVFVVTAFLGFLRVPHAINAGLVGGTLLFGFAAFRLPQISGSLLLQIALVQFATALAAAFAFRHVSLLNRKA